MTTAPAPTTVSFPIVTPGQTTTALPSHTLSPIVTGSADSQPSRRGSGSTGCVAVTMWTPVAILAVGADPDQCDVEHDAAEVDERPNAHRDVRSVVAVERWSDDHVVSNVSEQLAQQAGPQLQLRVSGGVVPLEEILGPCLVTCDLLADRAVELPARACGLSSPRPGSGRRSRAERCEQLGPVVIAFRTGNGEAWPSPQIEVFSIASSHSSTFSRVIAARAVLRAPRRGDGARGCRSGTACTSGTTPRRRSASSPRAGEAASTTPGTPGRRPSPGRRPHSRRPSRVSGASSARRRQDAARGAARNDRADLVREAARVLLDELARRRRRSAPRSSRASRPRP